MRWRRDWPGRKARPKVQPLSKEQKSATLKKLVSGIEFSPVLSSLSMRARALRGRFYIEQLFQNESIEGPEIATIGRMTPLVAARGRLLLEAENGRGNWYEVKKGFAKTLIEHIADDTKGTFHGLGTLNRSLREAGAGQRASVRMDREYNFTYKSTGKACSVQEALYHFFGMPISVISGAIRLVYVPQKAQYRRSEQ